jgi:hypothetical protein
MGDFLQELAMAPNLIPLATLWLSKGNLPKASLDQDDAENMLDWELICEDGEWLHLTDKGWQEVNRLFWRFMTRETLRAEDRGMTESVIEYVAANLPQALEIWFHGQRAIGECSMMSPPWDFFVAMPVGYSPDMQKIRIKGVDDLHISVGPIGYPQPDGSIAPDLGSAADWAMTDGIRVWSADGTVLSQGERRQRIKALYGAGIPVPLIGRLYSMTKQQVERIATRESKKRGPKPGAGKGQPGKLRPGSLAWQMERLKIGESFYSDDVNIDRDAHTMLKVEGRKRAQLEGREFQIRRLVTLHHDSLETARIVQIKRIK